MAPSTALGIHATIFGVIPSPYKPKVGVCCTTCNALYFFHPNPPQPKNRKTWGFRVQSKAGKAKTLLLGPPSPLYCKNLPTWTNTFPSNRTFINPSMFRDDFLMVGRSGPFPSPWSRLQDKLFERALVYFPEGIPDRWVKIAGQVPGKSPCEVREHYEALVHDVTEIDSGRIEIPCYAENSFTPDWASDCRSGQISFGGPKVKVGESERKKGIPWTEEEHRLFLLGLQKYGKGDWRSISRNAVVSRTPTQVASHAQKYYLRLKSVKKEKKRASIHDITTVQSEPVDPPKEQSWTEPTSSLVHQPTPTPETMVPQNPPAGLSEGQFPREGPYGYQHFGLRM